MTVFQTFRRTTRFALPALALGAAAFAATPDAAAQEVSPTGKGITGGALLGAEAVMLVEAALDVKPAWAYLVGGAVGGIGGGVGGYFVEQGSDAKPSLLLLAGGLVLAIPTTVAVLSVTSYDPPADYTEDSGPAADEPVADPPEQPGAATGQPTAKAKKKSKTRRRVARRSRKKLPKPTLHAKRSPALVGLSRGYLSLSVPSVSVHEVYTEKERLQFGLKRGARTPSPGAELHVLAPQASRQSEPRHRGRTFELPAPTGAGADLSIVREPPPRASTSTQVRQCTCVTSTTHS